jgi:hypothetical protein
MPSFLHLRVTGKRGGVGAWVSANETAWKTHCWGTSLGSAAAVLGSWRAENLEAAG